MTEIDLSPVQPDWMIGKRVLFDSLKGDLRMGTVVDQYTETWHGVTRTTLHIVPDDQQNRMRWSRYAEEVEFE